MTVRHTSTRLLTELQQAILDFVWTHGSATAEQIREGLLPRHRLKDASVRTILRRLEERGYLTHRVDGKVFVFEATMRRPSVAARAVQHIIDRFWAGSVEQFLTGMVDERVVSAAELRRLARKVGNKK